MSGKMFALLFVFLVCFVGCVCADCNLVINEVNTGSPVRLAKNDFIEFKMFCDSETKTKNLQGYKLIGLSAGEGVSANTQKMTIDLVINLWNSKINEKNMFTIGSDAVTNAELNVKSTFVTYRNKFSGNTQTIDSFLNKGNKHIHAIALLFKQSYTFPEFRLTAKKPFINIDEKLIELIKVNLIDLVVYARKAPYNDCHLFAKLCDEYESKDYILREFDNNKQGVDRTLSRCSFDNSTFIPEKFKLSKATSGEENDCSGVNFLLETHLSLLTNSPFDDENAEKNDELFETSESPQCFAVVDGSEFENLSDDAIEVEIAKETEVASVNQCSSLNLGPNDGNLADEIDRTNRKKRTLSDSANHMDVNEWESTTFFQ